MKKSNIETSITSILKFSFLIIYFLLMGNIELFSQTIPAKVKVAGEPVKTSIRRSCTNVEQFGMDNEVSWEGVSNLYHNDDQYTEIELLPGEKSKMIKGNYFNIFIPKGANVNGIELRFQGHVEGNGKVLDNHVELVRLNPVGENKANAALYGTEWASGTIGNDNNWTYGHKKDKWDYTWVSSRINNNAFGFQFQISNPSSDTIKVRLDHVDIKVYFLEMASFCSDECLTFYVDPYGLGESYEWKIPNGFMVVSAEGLNTMSIKPTTANNTTHNICATIKSPSGQTSSDCKRFRMKDCGPGTIGDFVWNDLNNDGIQDYFDLKVKDVLVQLYTDDGVFVAEQLTDDGGMYLFENIEEGYYYIELAKIEGYLPTLYHTTVVGKDSDLSLFQEDWKSNVFYLKAKENKLDIDLGIYSEFNNISGLAWYDNNQDGIYEVGESFLDGIKVNLYLADTILRTTTTDSLGAYAFLDLEAGTYFVEIETNVYDFSEPFKGNDPLIDSDITDMIIIGSTNEIVLMGQDVFGVNAGMSYKPSDISGIVWNDEDRDGLYLSGEELIEGILVDLYQADTVFRTTITDTIGRYTFDNLESGSYYIGIETSLYDFSSPHVGTDSLIDSDITGFFIEGSTDEITLVGLDIVGVNAGMSYKPSDIKGIVWEDGNKNGLYQVEERLIEGIVVNLYQADTIFSITMTDSLGRYSFVNLESGSYYIGIETDLYDFSSPHEGTDQLIDSDITGFYIEGSSDEVLLEGQDVTGINAGMSYKPSDISGIVWNDENQDGLYQSGEELIEGIVVNLYQADTIFSITMTDSFGRYSFVDLESGSYYIGIETDIYDFSSPHEGTDQLIDSDITGFYIEGSSDEVLLAGQDVVGINAGMSYKPSDISGIVWNDENQDGLYQSGEELIEGIIVNLYQPDTVFNLSTITDSLGRYSFVDLESGSYYIGIETDLFDFSSPHEGTDPLINSDITGFYSQGSSDKIVLEGQDIRGVNAGMFYLKASISGVVWVDDNENGIIDGSEELVKESLVVLKRGLGIVTSATTDENGYYIFDDLLADEYIVVFAVSNYDFSLPFEGADVLVDSDVTGINGPGSTNEYVLSGQDIVGVNAGLISVLGSISGSVWHDLDANGLQNESNGLEGVEMSLYHVEYGFFGTKNTDINGNYLFEDLIEGEYYVEFTLPADMNLSEYHIGSDTVIDCDFKFEDGSRKSDIFSIVNHGQIVNVDAGLYKYASIGDYVWVDINEDGIQNENESGLSGVQVNLISTDSIFVSSITDTEGNYYFDNVKPGSYYVRFVLPNMNANFTIPNLGNDSLDSDVIDIIGEAGSTSLVHLLSGDIDLTIDAGISDVITEYSNISGIVWQDNNADGILDVDEEGINEVWIYLYNVNNILVDSMLTDGVGTTLGSYGFNDLSSGEYYISFDINTLGNVSPSHQGTDPGIDSDVTNGNGLFTTDLIQIDGSPSNESYNAGVYQTASISGYIWKDLNNNNIYDESNKGFNDVIVKLLDEDGTEVSFTFTNMDNSGRNGYYSFNNVIPGNYIIKVIEPLNTLFVLYTDDNATINSDINHVNGHGTTSIIGLLPEDNIENMDAGLIEEFGSIANKIWIDCNQNNTYEVEELGLNGVIVELFNIDDELISIDTSKFINGEDGIYTFEEVESGLYYLVFNVGSEYEFVQSNVGGNDTKDSDVTSSIKYGATNIFDIDAGEVEEDIDAGVLSESLISGVVWQDTLHDGIRSFEEPLVSGVLVLLYDDLGVVLDSTYTNIEGKYSFLLTAGDYRISFDIDDLFVYTYSNIGDSDYDSDASTIGTTQLLTVIEGCPVLHQDAGIVSSLSVVKSNVWIDANEDGVRNVEELPMPNVKIFLISENNEIVDKVETDEFGRYAFVNLEEGNYYLSFIAPSGYDFTEKNVANDGYNDSDVNKDGNTDLFVVVDGIELIYINVGLLLENQQLIGIEQERSKEIGNTEIIIEDIIVKNNVEMSIFPNPIDSYCNIKIESKNEMIHVSTYQVVNMAGEIVSNGTLSKSEEYLNIQNSRIDFSNLLSGVYYLQVLTSEGVLNKKISILKD